MRNTVTDWFTGRRHESEADVLQRRSDLIYAFWQGGMTQAKIAYVVGISQQRVSQIINGSTHP